MYDKIHYKFKKKKEFPKKKKKDNMDMIHRPPRTIVYCIYTGEPTEITLIAVSCSSIISENISWGHTCFSYTDGLLLSPKSSQGDTGS